MISLLLHLLRLFPFLCGGHRQLALENLALRQQLAVYKRTVTRPKLRTTDRLFWVWLAKARVLGAGVLWPPVVSLTLGWSGRAQPVVQLRQTHRARHRALLPKETPHNPWCCSSTRFSRTRVLSAMTKRSAGRCNQRSRSDDSRAELRVSRR